MLCASVAECRDFLAPAGLGLDRQLRLTDQGAWDGLVARYYLVDRPDLDLPDLSRQLLDWLPQGRERLLLVSNWTDDSIDQPYVFEALRRGAGAQRGLREAPGQIFTASKEPGTDYENRPALDVAEESVAMWLTGLMLDWTWEGYVAVAGSADAIWLGDGFFRLLAASAESQARAMRLLDGSSLRYTVKFPW